MLWLLLACDNASIKLGDSAGTDSGVSPGDPAVTISGPDTVDPLLGSVNLSLSFTGGDSVRVEILGANGAVVRVIEESSTSDVLSWDGRDDAGAPLPPGPYQERATLQKGGTELLSVTRDVAVVRVGVLSGTLGGERIPLIWHVAGGPGMYWSDDASTTTFSLAAIDDGTTATPLPAVWTDLFSPPQDLIGANLPAAYRYDATPRFELVLDGETAGAPVQVSLDGWSCDVAWPALSCTRDEALSETIGVVEEDVVVRWSTPAGDFATQVLPIRLYSLLDVAAFERTEVPYQPWVAVIDPALRAINGTAPDAAAVTSALVEYIYYDLGLAYDTQWGASSYVQYTSGWYDGAEFDLSSFLTRRNGSIVNCTDCASILTAHANMVGVWLEYSIILSNFQLNYIKAIGGTEYTHCPFGVGGCGFSYHAVTSPDDSLTIYDATLALDGDDDPSSPPSTELLVQAIDGDEYLDRLVMSGRAYYDYNQQGTIQ